MTPFTFAPEVGRMSPRTPWGIATRSLPHSPRAFGSLLFVLSSAFAAHAAALTLTGFSPAGGGGGTPVNLTGSGFSVVTTVRFNGTVASFSMQNDGQITAYVPGTATTGPISVYDGASTANSATNFFVGAAPSIGSFSPSGGPVGTIVTINGSSFAGITSVRFNGVSAAYSVNSTSQITTTVPAGAASGPITVTNPAGTSTSSTFYFPPVVSSFAPSGGVTGTAVNVYGSNFAVAYQVLFNGVNASYSYIDNGHLLAYVPFGANTGPITVYGSSGTGSSPTSFFVGPAPTVAAATPVGGPAGTLVTVDGGNFLGTTSVTFSGVSAPFTVVGPAQLTATVPGAASSGPLAVSNPSGTGTWATTFFVGDAPVVSGFAPGTAAVGGSVTINGSGFIGATDVRFNGVSASGFAVVNNGQITATVPAGASSGPITVVNPTGSGASASSLSVSPKVVGLMPAAVAAASATGTLVSITGYNFSGASDVKFNGTTASFNVIDDRTLSAWVPAAATSGLVTVTTPYGTGTSPFPFDIVVFTPPPHSAFATWPLTPYQNVPLTTAPSDQYGQSICSDSTGGAYVAWQDARNGYWHVYLQRVTGYGDIAPGWPTGGLMVCTGDNSQLQPRVTADLIGGVYVVWTDQRTGAFDIYATRIQQGGTRAPGWSADGNRICTALNEQSSPAIATEGSGGAFIAWQDYRNNQWDIYVNHVLASGALAAGWDENGMWASTSNAHDYSPSLATDAVGGVYVSWNENSSYCSVNRILGTGLSASGWPSGGIRLTNYTCYYPTTALSDGAGGVIVVWSNNTPCAARIGPDGSAVPGWNGYGRTLANDGNARQLTAVGDGQAGVIAIWESGQNLRAQHVLGSGLTYPGWPSSGLYVRAESNNAYVPSAIPDGYGGVIATWYDSRYGDYDVFSQRLLGTGSVAPGWPTNGALVSGATSAQTFPVITPSTIAGAIVAWSDARGGGYDVYAQNIGLSGKPGNLEPHITSVTDIAGDQGGKARITWHASAIDTLPTLEISTYGVWREVTGAAAAASLKRGASLYAAADAEVRPGVLRRERANAQDTWWEGLGSIPSRGQATYSFVVSTLRDSSGADPATETYMVDAHASFGPYFWTADPASGHSVDNLSPPTPAGLTAVFTHSHTSLHWHAVAASDFATYRVYRGGLTSFDPSPQTLVGSTTDTAFVDANGSDVIYLVAAEDVHGNRSIPAVVGPSSLLDAGEPTPAVLELGAPSPNPAASETALRLRLPRASAVAMSAYDPAGRRVRQLAPRALPPGEHSLAWDLRDDGGRPVPGGLYFVQVTAAGRTFIRRVVVLQ